LLAFSVVANAQFTPAPNSPFPAGAMPDAVAVGDFNGDSYPDLAIASSTSNTVTILTGSKTGAFTQASGGSSFPVGSRPIAIAVGYFNADNILDLAVANQSDNTVSVLLGDGKGGFTQPHSPFPAGTNPSSIAVADFNDDHILDLAIVNQGSNMVTVLLGDGTGGFAQAPGGSSFPVGSRPVSIAVADFNLDTFPDLAIANQLDNTVTLLLGSKNGAFTPAPGSPFPLVPTGQSGLGLAPASVAVGDFNRDLLPDLVVANQGANNVSLLLGNGEGGFTLATDSPFQAGTEPVSVAVADFNEDGIRDLAIVNYQSGNVTVLLGNGTAGFTPAVSSPYTAGSSPVSVAIGDFNMDGAPDLAIVNKGSNTVAVLLNSISSPVVVSAASGLAPVALGSIVSIYGSNLAITATSASTPMPPYTLGGTSVTITDSTKAQASLPLFYAGPALINAQIPASAAPGKATLTVFTASGNQSLPAVLTQVAPGLFSANENGQGVAAGQFLTTSANGFQIVTDVFQCSGGPNTCITVPLNVSAGKTMLVLYGTGFRNAPLAAVSVMVGSTMCTLSSMTCPITYMGVGSNSTVDQVNVTLPASLAGSGLVPVSVSVAGVAGTSGTLSNSVTLYIQ
jgi:uncharacterized protein (TIGR03437 family)